MSRSAVELDEVDTLLQAAGRGDFDAFASFYDRTAPAVFNGDVGSVLPAARMPAGPGDIRRA